MEDGDLLGESILAIVGPRCPCALDAFDGPQGPPFSRRVNRSRRLNVAAGPARPSRASRRAPRARGLVTARMRLAAARVMSRSFAQSSARSARPRTSSVAGAESSTSAAPISHHACETASRAALLNPVRRARSAARPDRHVPSHVMRAHPAIDMPHRSSVTESAREARMAKMLARVVMGGADFAHRLHDDRDRWLARGRE